MEVKYIRCKKRAFRNRRGGIMGIKDLFPGIRDSLKGRYEMKKIVVIFGLIAGISLFFPKPGVCETVTQEENVEVEKESVAIANELVLAEVGRRFDAKEGKRFLAKELIFEGLSQEEKNALAELRKKDPEKFKESLKQKLKEQREVLKKLKEENPEEFKKVVGKKRQKIRERMRKLKEEDPEKFKELMCKRAQMRKKRLKKLCQDDPEKCREIMGKRREHFKEKLEELKETDPQKYEQIKERIKRRKEKRKQHEGWKEKEGKVSPDLDRPGEEDVNP